VGEVILWWVKVFKRIKIPHLLIQLNSINSSKRRSLFFLVRSLFSIKLFYKIKPQKHLNPQLGKIQKSQIKFTFEGKTPILKGKLLTNIFQN
jgi:hypothetical protein